MRRGETWTWTTIPLLPADAAGRDGKAYARRSAFESRNSLLKAREAPLERFLLGKPTRSRSPSPLLLVVKSR